MKMKRLSEPSTWAGFGAFLQMLSQLLPQYAIPLHIATGVAASLAVSIPEIGTRKTGD
jgi:hypothetical protein